MVAAGEAGGILDIILNRLSNYMEKMAKLKRQIKGAMTYPVITLIVAVVVVAIILVFVIPVFSEMFSSFGSTLPTPTLIVVAMSNFVIHNIGYIIGGIFAIIFILRRIYANQKGRIFMDEMFLRLPVIGLLIRKVAVAKFTRTASTMLSSGVSILEVLDIVAKTAGNKIVEFAIQDVRSGISEGRGGSGCKKSYRYDRTLYARFFRDSGWRSGNFHVSTYFQNGWRDFIIHGNSIGARTY